MSNGGDAHVHLHRRQVEQVLEHRPARAAVYLQFGKIGTNGQTQERSSPTRRPPARSTTNSSPRNSKAKGYVETTAGRGRALLPTPVSRCAGPRRGETGRSAARHRHPSPPPPPPPGSVGRRQRTRRRSRRCRRPPQCLLHRLPLPGTAGAQPLAASGGLRTFEFSDASAKFWNIDLHGTRFYRHLRPHRHRRQTQEKTFSDPAKAQKEYDKLVAEKVKKGYRETTPTAPKAPASLRESLEQAIVENPDDLASHMAYADYLSDHGDPRGEFIQVQLALEDPARSPDERKRLQAREKELLDAHLRDWAGDLAPYLSGENKGDSQYEWRRMEVQHTFARGWLHTIDVNNFDVEFTRTLTRSPEARLLRRLVLRESAYQEPGEYEMGDDIPEDSENPQLYPLIRCPYLTNVREFVLGELGSMDNDPDDEGFNCHNSADGVVGVIKAMPKLEELYLLAHNLDADQLFSLRTLHRLRVLLVYHTLAYPLGRLAKNPSLGNLTHLLCHPHALEEDPSIRQQHVQAIVRSPELRSLTHLRLRLCDAGDDGIREIITSGILKRLKYLDLRHGCVTDEGARLLAACPDVRYLDHLDLSHNAMTDAGVQALQATGVKLLANNQWRISGDEWNDREYLYAGDIE
ncbi:MAG: TIGR02996 domain-containing protein [Gemmataceae bacterium]